MVRISPLFLMLAACGGDPGAVIDAQPGGDVIDAEDIDAPPDVNPCIGGGLLQICLATLPTQPFTYDNDAMVTTSAAVTCETTTNPEADGLCVVAATVITIPAGKTVRAVGSKPLVFVATDAIVIAGTLDVSTRGDMPGAGANFTGCTAGTNATGGNSSGGGYGGSFGGRGANGLSNDGGFGGIAPVISATPTTLRGGCPGGPGGPLSTVSAAGGDGGGAVALVARNSIDVSNGTINASGGGGKVGNQVRQGSGGGGSGGMILLEAPAITATAGSVFANGGGGGEGNGSTAGQPGGEPPSAGVAAPGGANFTANGGDGGAGSVTADGGQPPTNANPSGGGGGGGGGGAGVIRASQALTGATVTPAAI